MLVEENVHNETDAGSLSSAHAKAAKYFLVSSVYREVLIQQVESISIQVRPMI